MGIKKKTYTTELLLGLSEVMYEKHLEQWLVHEKYYVNVSCY